MQELSMHLLDIAENSVKAGATLIELGLAFDDAGGTLAMSVGDNGSGMSEEMLRRVTDPFCTTRTTRRVGLGLPLLKMAAELTGGTFCIQSRLGEGTTVKAVFMLGHIDLMPLGDMAGTVAALIQCNPAIDFVFTASRGDLVFEADTRQFREILGGVPLSDPEVAVFIKEYLSEHLQPIIKEGA